MLRIRLAAAHDRPFLERVLAMAADWREETSRAAEETIQQFAVERYVAGWPQPRDRGVVADEAGPVGAAWWRYFDEDDPGYGFVKAEIPEITLGVVPDARGQGVGTRLLLALIQEAQAQQVVALSVSVEADNPARRLYERCGFKVIEQGSALTMVLLLGRSGSRS